MANRIKRVKAIKTDNNNGRVSINVHKDETSREDNTIRVFNASNNSNDCLNLREELKSYLSTSKTPISKGKIASRFSELDLTVLNDLLDDQDILDFKTGYILFQTINVTDEDRERLFNYLVASFSDREVIHVRDLFNTISKTESTFLRKKYIYRDYSLFSVLEHMFKNEFSFKRPHIAKSSTSFIEGENNLRSFLSSEGIVKVSSFLSLARSNSIAIGGNTLRFLNGFNDTAFLLNSKELIAVDRLPFDEKDYQRAERRLGENGVKGILAEKALELYFADIDYKEADGWLVYCLVNKWGKEYRATSTKGTLDTAIPFICRNNISVFQEEIMNESEQWEKNNSWIIKNKTSISDVESFKNLEVISNGNVENNQPQTLHWKLVAIKSVDENTIRELQTEYTSNEESHNSLTPCDFSVFRVKKEYSDANDDENNIVDDRPYNTIVSIPKTVSECEARFGFYKIDDSRFSVRTLNGLRNAHINTIDALAALSPNDVGKIRNLGEKSVREVSGFFKSFEADNDGGRVYDDKWLSINRDYFRHGNFSDCLSFSEQHNEYLNVVKKAYELLGSETVEQIYSNGLEWVAISDSLAELSRALKYSQLLSDALKGMPKYRIKNHFDNYLRWFISVYPQKRFDLSSDQGKIETLSDLTSITAINLISEAFELISVLQSSLFDELTTKIETQLSTRVIDVILARANGNTLEEIAIDNNLTRERIRQIENKGLRVFNSWFTRNKIPELLFADLNGAPIVSEQMIYELAEVDSKPEQYAAMLWYALNHYFKKTNNSRLNKGYIVLGDFDFEAAEKVVASLPAIFDRKEIAELVDHGQGYSDYVLRKIDQNYILKDGIYSRNHLNNSQKVEYILRYYYPMGIKVYDADEIKQFADKLQSIFDYKYTSQHALESLISKVGVLCDRGTYIAPGARLPKTIVYRIKDWIDKQNTPTVLIQSIYLTFEKELNEESVYNKYQLQGLLKQEDLGEAVVWRDYVLKEEHAGNIYETLQKYVSGYEHPVSKKQIQHAFPGISDIVINYAFEGSTIINLFGEYIDVNQIKTDNQDKVYLHNTMEYYLNSKGTIHVSEMYEYIKKDNGALLKKLGLYRSFGLFSLLQYWFSNEAEFSRPFIAPAGERIIPSYDQIESFVEEQDLLLVEDLMWKANSLFYTVQDIRKFLESFFESHVLLNKKTLASVKLLELTKDNYLQVENEAISGNKSFSVESLQTQTNMKYLQETDVWFMYSLVKKWGQRLDAKVNGHNYAEAIPIITIKGSGEEVLFDNFVNVDNPEMIQALYEEIIALEMETGNELFEF